MPNSDRVNLAHTTVLLIDDQPTSLSMLGSIVQGFGCKEQIKCPSAEAAVELLARRSVDLILIDCIMPDMDGYDFVRWLRRDSPAPTRYVPVIMILGHASQAKVHQGRDCGASFIVAKPLSPSMLLKRIIWLGGEDRDFVESEHYIGPDRRVRNYGPPPGTDGRRESDLTGELGEAVEENMDQETIDMLMKPMKVSL
ncbi:CheY-like chemotaxis protein [Brevundimonas vesicularis]|uniref:CheY-like chemotaxis protein n=1 Tax=Brevundimonas vesicularis TaxID=41276 RepID=A0A7W9L667_BREVE|nr:response regulator [Brevundimonas vesicularis]MBB5772121.1 CheY-like chemotaxis protein [Brevundimonas vesicularis]